MKKTVTALVAIAAMAGSLVSVTPPAQAHDGVGVGIAAGLLGGAIVGGAIAASRPAPAYPAPAYVAAPPMDEVDETVSPLSRLTRAANYLDLPAASLPCGLTSEGMPAGLQIMARPADEAGLVTLAAAFEAVSGWNGRSPDLSGFR